MPAAQITFNDLINLSGHVEKLGIIGFLVLVVGVMGWALWKFRKELGRTYRQRDKARAIQFVYKQALDNAGIKVDISYIEQQFRDDLAEEAGA